MFLNFELIMSTLSIFELMFCASPALIHIRQSINISWSW